MNGPKNKYGSCLSVFSCPHPSAMPVALYSEETKCAPKRKGNVLTSQHLCLGQWVLSYVSADKIHKA
jgi:hypothetical protein